MKYDFTSKVSEVVLRLTPTEFMDILAIIAHRAAENPGSIANAYKPLLERIEIELRNTYKE